MSKLFESSTQGLPALVGVVWGAVLYSPSAHRWWLPATTLLVAFAFLSAGKRIVGKWPLVGCSLIEVWVASAVSIVAISTMLILWLSLHAPGFLQGDDNEKKAIGGALVGAVTAYLAALWTKDIQSSEGPFWAGSQFKEAVQASFKDSPLAPLPDTREWDIVWAQRVRDNGPIGWGLKARWGRSSILSSYLKSSNPPAGEDS